MIPPVEKTNYWKSTKAWKSILSNFFIWCIPGVFVLAIMLVVLFISFTAADGSLFEIDPKLPKGMYSFLSISFIASAISCGVLVFKFHLTSVEDLFGAMSLGLVMLLIGGHLLRKELKRLG